MKKVLMLPWLAHGHISPFLELARMLSLRGFSVFLCSTPVNLSSVRRSVPEEGSSSSVKLVEINLPVLPNLPPLYHTTRGLPPRLMNTLKSAFDASGPALAEIIKCVSPDLLVYDFLLPWAPLVAGSCGIPAVLFAPVGAGMASFVMHMFAGGGKEYPFDIHVDDYFLSQVNDHLSEEAENGISVEDRVTQCFARSSKVVLLKTFRDFEGKYIDYLSQLTGKKVVPVGPLVPGPSQEDEHDLIQWLDEKENSSTIFVSFGTEYFLSEKEREEIAYGLELSNVNFIWVLRFPAGEEIAIEDALPIGFLERVKNRGIVVDTWAPQAIILAHPSIGGFVSHCGWSSVMESMKFGVPVVAIPMHLDQPLNARVIEGARIGVEIKRGKGGKLERDEIARQVRCVVFEEDGASVRQKAKEVRNGIASRGDADIDEVANELIRVSGV
ncbi:hypothetical protein MLD38_003757 [Melastoma candidum]|uniref:Uncharacterized protein n=1 Tax=Melastoma candidum TaxID=119954 RepID=A0ACB9S3V3_9MYRT|nr:hypothetical protein MLD38_003757 [Melastoma candidum]